MASKNKGSMDLVYGRGSFTRGPYFVLSLLSIWQKILKF